MEGNMPKSSLGRPTTVFMVLNPMYYNRPSFPPKGFGMQDLAVDAYPPFPYAGSASRRGPSVKICGSIP